MKKLKTPKTIFKKNIYFNREKIGRLQLVKYLSGFSLPHLEFKIDDKKRQNRGIMSEELPKFLKNWWFLFYKSVLATTIHNHAVAQKLLEKNGFRKMFVKKHLVVYLRGNASLKRVHHETDLLIKNSFEK